MHKLYGISNCDTVRRARAWLIERGMPHEFHDFKPSGVPPLRLDAWLQAVGWEALLNRKGLTWRRLAETQREHLVDAASARALMLEYPSVIRRPVVEWADGRITVGFDPASWSRPRP
jgi:Spx/MgsR family transcriptional regulator